MRIALCLSGQPRFIKLGYQFIKKYLLDNNNNIDIFLHAWYNPLDVDKPYNSAQLYSSGHVGYVEKDTDLFLVDNFKPKKYIIEPQIDFSEYSKNLPNHQNAKKEIMCSIFYSIFKSNELKKKYELENNFNYDLVVRTRYDLAYFDNINFFDYMDNLNKIHVLKNYQEDQDMFNSSCNPMPDIFSFSNSKNMDIFSSVFPNMKQISENLDIPFGERYLGEWVRNKNKLEISKINKKIVILHRMPDLMKYYKNIENR